MRHTPELHGNGTGAPAEAGLAAGAVWPPQLRAVLNVAFLGVDGADSSEECKSQMGKAGVYGEIPFVSTALLLDAFANLDAQDETARVAKANQMFAPLFLPEASSKAGGAVPHRATAATPGGGASTPSISCFQDRLRKTDVFCDLGSGVGKAVIQVFLASNVRASWGIELGEDRHKKALETKQRVLAGLRTMVEDNAFEKAREMEEALRFRGFFKQGAESSIGLALEEGFSHSGAVRGS